MAKRSSKPMTAEALRPRFSGFGRGATDFLAGLARHNDAGWFEKHREAWERELLAPAKGFVSALGPRLRELAPRLKYEPKVGGSIFRLHRDVRFSKDKSPYRTHLDLWLWEGPNRGWDGSGFFLRLTANALVLGAGRQQITGPALQRYRRAVGGKAGARLAETTDALREAGWRIGEVTLKKVPAGFEGDHPRAELLRHGALFAELTSPVPVELTRPSFVDWCAERLALAAPVHAWIMENVA